MMGFCQTHQNRKRVMREKAARGTTRKKRVEVNFEKLKEKIFC